MGAFGVDGAPPLLRAMNLLLDRPARDIATAAPGPLGPDADAVPWRGFVLVGTHQSVAAVPPDETRAAGRSRRRVSGGRQRDVPDAHGRAQATSACVHHGLTPAVMRGGRRT